MSECRRASGANDAGQEAERENRAAGDGVDPAMDEYAAVFFIVDGVAGNGLGDDVHGVPAPGELGALRKSLSLGAAFKRVKVAHDIANAQWRLLVVRHRRAGIRCVAQPGSCTFLSFLKCG